MKKIIIITLLLSSGIVLAQQRAQFSQYFVNQYVLNPAAGGTDGVIDVKLGSRFQWVGFEGAPNTYYMSFHMPIGKESGSSYGHHRGSKDNWHGLGGYVYKDVTGPTSRTAGYMSYAYNLAINRHLRISTGVFVGAQEYKIDGTGFLLTDPVDQVLNGVQSKIVPDMIAGTWIYNENFFIGIAAHQLLQNELTFSGITDPNDDQVSKLNNHLFVTSGVKFKMNQDWFVVPSLMAKYVSPAPLSLDVNCKVQYKNSYWFGGSYRGLDSFILIAGMTIAEYFQVSYSLDITHSELRKYNYGSHEIVLSWLQPWPKRIDCPSKFW